MEITKAIKLFSVLPPNLSSLVISQRSAVGKTLRLISVGDMGFSGGVREIYQEDGDYDKIFSDLKPLLSSSDLLFGNLETPLIENSTPNQLFAGDPKAISALKLIGFDLLHLANNHVLDYGLSGFLSTIELLQHNGIAPLGTGKTKSIARKLFVKNVNGIRIGWLGCGRTRIDQKGASPIYWEFNEDELLKETQKLKSQVDVLILSIHIGLMYLDYPKPELKKYVKSLFQAGANLILMHHAHVLQSVQIKPDGKICCYNLGNFILDWQEGNVVNKIMVKEQNESAVFVFDIDKRGIVQTIAIPTYIDEEFSIRWATGARGREILARLQRISKDIQGDYTKEFEQQRAERNAAPIIGVAIYHFKKGNWSDLADMITHVRFEHLKMFFRFILNRFLKTV